MEKRKGSFWSRGKRAMLNWSIIESASKLCMISERIIKELRSRPDLNTVDFIARYCSDDEPWLKLDTYHRELEKRYEIFDIGISADHSLTEKVVVKSRQIYTDTLGDLAQAFQDACKSEGFVFEGTEKQRDVFNRKIKPSLGKHKIAYIIVDALRYEMAAELCAGIGEGFDAVIAPVVAAIPCITEIGMASLLPSTEGDFSLVNMGKGKIGLSVDGKALANRQDRINFIKEESGEYNITTTKLEDVIKPRKNLKEQIANSNFILVTSQEIDEICEQGNASLAHQLMSEILAQIRRAILNLSTDELGIEYFIITADHGYIFLEELEEGNKVDAPGGQTIDLHPRAWIGKGGAKSSSYIRVTEKDIGYSGSLELAFPKRLGCFRVKGPDNPYFHGGISLQELVVPVISISRRLSTIDKVSSDDFVFIFDKPKITNRLFSVMVTWKSPIQQRLNFVEKKHKRVRLVVTSNKKDIGIAVQAEYGYEDGTGDIILEKDRPNYVTMMITDESIQHEQVSLKLLDPDTLVELKKLDKELDITL